ncbi:MAG: hypothetical protein ACRDJX_10550 [Solirubrobacteraceae bacterium]
MRRVLLATGITALVLCCANAALAGQFSAPVRIPAAAGGEFAINSHGEVVAVEGSEDGARVYSLGTGSSFEHLLPLSVAGGYSLATGSEGISFGSDGSIALGLSYIDGTAPAVEGEGDSGHGSPACCRRAAVAAWQLGEPPPAVHTLTPKLDPDDAYEKEPDQPAVLVRRSVVTALWSDGGDLEFPEEGTTTLREAFGPVGKPLHVKTLAVVPNGINRYVLTKTASNLPLAAWLDDNGELHVVTGTATGALKRSHRAQSVHGGVNPNHEFAFTTDGVGDIIFWYVLGGSGHSELFMRTSTNGGAFSPPQLIARIRGEIWKSSVLAGPHRSVLARWEWEDRHETMYLRAAFGHIGRPLVRSVPMRVTVFGGEATGFVGRGEAFIIYRHELPGHALGEDTNFQLRIISDRSGHSFDSPKPFMPQLNTCGIDTAAELVYQGEAEIATSPNGYAILNLVCDEGEEDRVQYLVRYTP